MLEIRLLCSLCVLASFKANAAPFWCGGDDTFDTHPLQQQQLALAAGLTKAEQYQRVKESFVMHVAEIGQDAHPFVQTMTADLEILTDPESRGFLRHERLEPSLLFRRGYPDDNCDVTPVQLLTR